MTTLPVEALIEQEQSRSSGSTSALPERDATAKDEKSEAKKSEGKTPRRFRRGNNPTGAGKSPDGDRPKLRSHLKFRDLMSESIAGLEARPARSILTVLGTVLGITALVATLGVSRTAGNQIVARFDAFAATEVSLQPSSGAGGSARSSTIPWNAEARLMRLNGVIAAGTLTQVNINGALSRTTGTICCGKNQTPNRQSLRCRQQHPRR
jgi:hypothetical protein